MSYDSKRIIRALRERKANFQKRINEEERRISRGLHKSRTIRMQINATHGSRKNWYLDRMQELDLVIDYLNGKMKRRDFINHLINDDANDLLTFIGNI